MAIRTLAEFLEALKAEDAKRGFVNYNTTVEEPAATTGSSGTRRYGVLMMPRRPQPKREAPQGGTDE